MSDSTISKKPPLAPLGYTALAILISLVCRGFFMPKWSPIEEPSQELSFLILWVMAVLPILYLSFRRWAENSLHTFFPQVIVFTFLAFGIQTALNAISIGFDLLKLPSAALMPFVWALPWLALTTVFKTSYTTGKQCQSLLLMLVPLTLVFHLLYLILPAVVLAYGGTGSASAALFGLVVFFYSAVIWRLKNLKTRITFF